MDAERASTGTREWPAGLSPQASLIDTLNSGWTVAGSPPPQPSFRQRIAYRIRLLLARLLGRQEIFNSVVVQYINGTTSRHQAMVDAMATTVERCENAIDAALREREAVAAREHRIEAAMAAMRLTHDELRTSVGVLQQATQSLKHEVARMSTAPATGEGVAATAPPAPGATARALDSHKYVGFEDQFRGTPEAIRERLSSYVPLFDGASDVLDVGCGRGEFLLLLREHGISARGLDTNSAMVQVSREKGLQAEEGDALNYLRAQPERSLGGLFAAQVVEHLDPAYLTAFLDAAFDALRPGAPIVLETINPACWFAFFESYIRDITHVRPLHPETLTYLMVASGFQRLNVRYRAPYPDHEKLQPIAPNTALADSVDTLNGNVEKINRLLFTYLDYAAIGYRS